MLSVPRYDGSGGERCHIREAETQREGNWQNMAVFKEEEDVLNVCTRSQASRILTKAGYWTEDKQWLHQAAFHHPLFLDSKARGDRGGGGCLFIERQGPTFIGETSFAK